jgi:hypothetical protein
VQTILDVYVQVVAQRWCCFPFSLSSSLLLSILHIDVLDFIKLTSFGPLPRREHRTDYLTDLHGPWNVTNYAVAGTTACQIPSQFDSQILKTQVCVWLVFVFLGALRAHYRGRSGGVYFVTLSDCHIGCR